MILSLWSSMYRGKLTHIIVYYVPWKTYSHHRLPWKTYSHNTFPQGRSQVLIFGGASWGNINLSFKTIIQNFKIVLKIFKLS